jgi:hypothetical protein
VKYTALGGERWYGRARNVSRGDQAEFRGSRRLCIGTVAALAVGLMVGVGVECKGTAPAVGEPNASC